MVIMTSTMRKHVDIVEIGGDNSHVSYNVLSTLELQSHMHVHMIIILYHTKR